MNAEADKQLGEGLSIIAETEKGSDN